MANFDEIVMIHMIENIENYENEVRQRFLPDDPFALSDYNFVKLFRLRKADVENLEDLLGPYFTPVQRISSLNIRTKILAALRFFAGGSYQIDVGRSHVVSISQPSISRSLHEVLNAINEPVILNRFIYFPRNVNELTNLRERFHNAFGFPGIVGCIDGTHVAIVRPVENENIYVNRKRYRSLNVQIICDENRKIMNANARYPGSTHDSYVWQNSNIFRFMQNFPAEHMGAFYLLGDSGYPLRPWMMTPILPEPLPNTPEHAYNREFRHIRSIVEQCHGRLKNRFRCLLKHRTLHYSPQVAGKIVNACAVLHNVCIDNNIPLYNDNVVNVDDNIHEQFANEPNIQNNDLLEGRRIRQMIVRNYFHN